MVRVEIVADRADVIINGFAFEAVGKDIKVTNLNCIDHAAVFSQDGTLIKTSMDDIELVIVTGYLANAVKYMDDDFQQGVGSINGNEAIDACEEVLMEEFDFNPSIESPDSKQLEKMTGINLNNDSTCESRFPVYEIPMSIDEKIPNYFYPAFTGELCAVFGWQIFKRVDALKRDESSDESIEDKNSYYYDLSCGTSGWVEAFNMACKKLDMMWLMDYRHSLEWFDCDKFDEIIEERIIRNCEESNGSSRIAYYQYLLKK